MNSIIKQDRTPCPDAPTLIICKVKRYIPAECHASILLVAPKLVSVWRCCSAPCHEGAVALLPSDLELALVDRQPTAAAVLRHPIDFEVRLVLYRCPQTGQLQGCTRTWCRWSKPDKVALFKLCRSNRRYEFSTPPARARTVRQRGSRHTSRKCKMDCIQQVKPFLGQIHWTKIKCGGLITTNFYTARGTAVANARTRMLRKSDCSSHQRVAQVHAMQPAPPLVLTEPPGHAVKPSPRSPTKARRLCPSMIVRNNNNQHQNAKTSEPFRQSTNTRVKYE